jgi:hypothetical protein
VAVEPGEEADDDRLVALFETRAAAERARDELMEEGIDAERIDLVCSAADAAEVDREAQRDHAGVWGAMKRLFLPEEDTHHFSEGVSRGHAVLAVRPDPGFHDRVVAILEQFAPIDLGARSDAWRAAGWDGAHRGQAEHEQRVTLGSAAGATTATTDTTEAPTRAPRDAAARVRRYGGAPPAP